MKKIKPREVKGTLFKNNPTKLYAYLYLHRYLYQFISDKDFKDIDKIYIINSETVYKSFIESIDELHRFYEKVEKRDFYVSLDELYIEMMPLYHNFYLEKNTEDNIDNVPLFFYNMWVRLKQIYLITKDNPFDYKPIIEYCDHRQYRRFKYFTKGWRQRNCRPVERGK